MKKTLVVLLILAVAGGVFAQEVSWSGGVHGRSTIISGTTNKTPEPSSQTEDEAKDFMYAGAGMSRLRIEVAGQNDEGTFGAWLRFDANNNAAQGKAWWKPIDMLKLQLGGNSDGEFNKDGFAAWGFNNNANDAGVAVDGFGGAAAFYGGSGGLGTYLFLTPVDGLEISIAVPKDSGLTDPEPTVNPYKSLSFTGFLYDKTQAQVAYTMEGLGTFALTYAGGRGTVASYTAPTTSAPSYKVSGNGAALYAFADLTMIENLGLNVGLKYTMPAKQDGGWTYNAPVAVGVAASYDISDEFGVKLRTQVELAGKAKPNSGDSVKLPMVFGLDVLPYYAVSESMTAFLNAGFKYTAKEKDVGMDGAFLDWFLNPYMCIAEGPGAFYAGFKLEGTGERKYKVGNLSGKADSFIDWSIPIGILFSF